MKHIVLVVGTFVTGLSIVTHSVPEEVVEQVISQWEPNCVCYRVVDNVPEDMSTEELISELVLG
jgi:acetolactate synthase small subunit